MGESDLLKRGLSSYEATAELCRLHGIQYDEKLAQKAAATFEEIRPEFLHRFDNPMLPAWALRINIAEEIEFVTKFVMDKYRSFLFNN